MKPVKKSTVLEEVVSLSGYDKESCKKIISMYEFVITNLVANGDAVSLRDFGRFIPTRVKGKLPFRGNQEFDCVTVKFRPYGKLKKALNK